MFAYSYYLNILVVMIETTCRHVAGQNIHASGLLAGSKQVLGHSAIEISVEAPKRTFLFQL